MLSIVLDPELLAPERVRPLYRREYDRLVELGVFVDERVELLRGVLVEMTPQGAPHAHVVSRLTDALHPRLGRRAQIRIQLPVALSEDSEPEPDVALVPRGDYSREHPSEALLLIEVAHSSLRKDLELKAALYAEAGVREYWVVDLRDDALVVHRDPSGGAYRDVHSLGRGQQVTPIAFPDVVVPVEELLT